MEIVFPADQPECSSSSINVNQEQEKGDQDQNAKSTPPSTSRSTPAKDILTVEIDQMTKK